MPKQVTIDAYEYSELTARAKSTANALVNEDHFWRADTVNSFSAVKAHVEALSDTDMTEEQIKAYLCERKERFDFTGYCADFDAVDAALACVETDDDGLVRLSARRYDNKMLACIDADYTDQCADEQTADMCDANGYLFDANGNFIHHMIKAA